MVKSKYLPIDLIPKAGGWRSMELNAKHYDKPIEENRFAYNP